MTAIQHRTTGAICALKQLKHTGPYQRERLTREIAVLRRLQHPNVIALTEAAEDSSWYVMPKGTSLKEFWPSRRASPSSPAELFEESLCMIRGVLAGLAEAHDIDLVHRDIKPANILVIDDVPKIADFGIVHVPEEERLTQEPAGNSFAPHAPSLYRPQHSPKSIDCFGVATLWAWMLASNPQAAYGHYHWRWHTFINHDGCEITRATLAACSDDQHGPDDARALLRFLEREIGIRGDTFISRFDKGVATKVGEAQAIAKAKAMQKRLSQEALITSIAWAIRSFADAVVTHCRNLVSSLQSQGAEIHHVVGTTTDAAGRLVSNPSLEELLAWSSARPGRICPMLRLSCRSDPSDRTMEVAFAVVWHQYPHEDSSTISFALAFSHVIPELCRTRFFKVSRAGAVLDENEVANINPMNVTRHIDDFLLDPRHHT